MKRIGVIGGGFAGLSFAYELTKRGVEVVVLEGKNKVGGLAAGFKKRDWDWSLEFFYHHIFRTDRDFLNLTAELGLKNKVFFRRPRTSVWLEGKIAPLDSPSSVLRFPKLSFPSRLRLGLGTAVLRLSPYFSFYEKIEANRALPFLVGEEAYRRIWKPLLEQKFSSFYRGVPLSWFWARIKTRTPKLGYFQGGFLEFAQALAEKVESRGGRVLTGRLVEKIERERGGFVVYTKRGEFEFERLVLALPLSVALRIAGNLLEEERERYGNLGMLGAAVLILRLKKQFFSDGTYWLNIADSNFPFVAAVEHTNFVDPKFYAGEHLVYLGGYYPWDHRIFRMKKEEVFRLFLPAAKKLNPSFQDDILGFEFFSSPFAQPLPTFNYSQIAPCFSTSLRGLYWLTLHHIHPWDRGINFAIKYGRDLAELVLGELG